MILEILERVIYSIPGILLAFTFHSYAKGKMADKLGDKTARFQGRLNLNPLNHIDPIGTLLILVCGIGWAKPIETDPRAFKNFYKDDLKVSLAGPFALFGLGIVFSLIYAVMYTCMFKFAIANPVYVIILKMVAQSTAIFISLFVFYLLPLPGLDGFNIFRDISPKNFYKYGEPLLHNQFLILIGIVLFAGPILRYPMGWILSGLQYLAFSIVGIFL